MQKTHAVIKGVKTNYKTIVKTLLHETLRIIEKTLKKCRIYKDHNNPCYCDIMEIAESRQLSKSVVYDPALLS